MSEFLRDLGISRCPAKLKVLFEPLKPTIVAGMWAGAELWIKDALCTCTQKLCMENSLLLSISRVAGTQQK